MRKKMILIQVEIIDNPISYIRARLFNLELI